jgi:phosphoadenosine phosphosulfate reductase
MEPQEFEPLSAEERIARAVRYLPETTVATSSFGADSAVLLHLISRVAPRLPVIVLNTGFLFPETLEYKDQLQRMLGLNLREVTPLVTREQFLARHGPVYRSNPDFCCGRNKVEPMRRALAGVECWISGVRRDQTSARARLPVLERQNDGLYKLNPIIDWDQQRVREYAARHGLPEHPLAAEGYCSIGCEPCTAKPRPGGDSRSGRWPGHAKTECGIHFLFEPAHGTAE